MTRSALSARSAVNASLLVVEPAPHLVHGRFTTRRMMLDVLLALVPVTGMAVYVMGLAVLGQVALCVASCAAAEALCALLRRRRPALDDASAPLTGVILALSIPAGAPVYVGVIGSVVAIGIGKAAFGGLGQNIFNPAMVGRAFVMLAFASAMGAEGYVRAAAGAADAVTGATPLTAFKEQHLGTALTALLVGRFNGSPGELSAVMCLIGGLYLCLRRTASWQIPFGVVLSAALFGGLETLTNPGTPWTVGHHLLGGALLFGAFFIATDPVTSPLTPKGKFLFGAGVGGLVILIRRFSGYPEGVMFSVLLMNALVPLINRWTIPEPVGGPARVKRA
jgi:electron transport complex protein RnfD